MKAGKWAPNKESQGLTIAWAYRPSWLLLPEAVDELANKPTPIIYETVPHYFVTSTFHISFSLCVFFHFIVFHSYCSHAPVMSTTLCTTPNYCKDFKRRGLGLS